jgi:signal peptidase I
MFKRITSWLSWLVLSALMITLAFVLVVVRQGWEFDAVLSGSMQPEFRVGGLVVIKPVDVDTLEIGDVISFRLPGIDTPICHRIIDIQSADGQKSFQTKGDANEEPDMDLVPLASVNGKAIFYTPYVGRLAEVRNLGITRIPVLGKELPAAAMFVLFLGILFIGLVSKELIEDIYWPEKRWRRERRKKRNERLLSRRARM